MEPLIRELEPKNICIPGCLGRCQPWYSGKDRAVNQNKTRASLNGFLTCRVFLQKRKPPMKIQQFGTDGVAYVPKII